MADARDVTDRPVAPFGPTTLDPSFWDRQTEILSASMSGMNLTQQLPVILKRHPALADYQFGFFTFADLPARMQDLWLPMKPEMLPGWDAYNERAPMQYGLVVKEGLLTIKGKVLCVMHKDYRLKFVEARNAHNRELQRKTMHRVRADEHDEEGVTSEGSVEASERFHLGVPEDAPARGPKRGRPRKT